jgi:hypothetical protein
MIAHEAGGRSARPIASAPGFGRMHGRLNGRPSDPWSTLTYEM